jgi:hypothetical protein
MGTGSAGRQHDKVQLVKGLYDRGWAAEEVRELFRLIDWMMDLPPEQEQGFREEILQWKAERGIQYITSISTAQCTSFSLPLEQNVE